MPAPVPVRPRERLIALAGVALVQLGLGAALLIGLRVDVFRRNEIVSRLVEIALPQPPPKVAPTPVHRPEWRIAEAPKAQRRTVGASPGPIPARALPVPTPIASLPAKAPVPGGGGGVGTAVGSGAGGGRGGEGYGEGEGGGTDLVQIAGAILPSDYPRDLRERGVGGRVGLLFTVGIDGRVTSCTVTRSSGIPELDALTCRLIRERFRYRPSTDRYGRPIPDEVEGEHDWSAGRG